jgi:Bacterial Ig-like domain (group 2)
MRVRQLFPRRPTSRAVVLPLIALAALTTFACNLDKLTKPATGAQTPLNASVSGDTTVSMGATLPLSITTATGALSSAVAVVYSSDNPLIATVNAATGVVTGVSIGTATISATISAPELDDVAAAALKVRVKYAGISIKAVDSLIAIGMTKVIDVRGTNPAGVAQASIPFAAATMTVVSRDPTIFTVNANGALVAVKNGSARVFVQFDGLKDSVIVKVRQVTRAMTYVGTVAGQLPVGSLNKDRTIAITAADSLGVAIAAPTVTWATSDLTTMSIVAATGVARALKLGTVTITATSDGFVKTVIASITQVPASLTKTATTDAQSAVVNTAVALPPEVTVVDSGNTPIPSVAVTFAIASGGGTVTGSPTSDVTGKAAATSWVLGTTVGANTVLASAGGASATFTATGTFAAPKKLGFLVQPSNAAVSAIIAPAIQVAVLDSLGNVVTTATTPITLALGSGTGTLNGGTGTLTVNAVAGIATFSTLSINTAGGFTLLATTSGLISATSNSFGIFGAAAKLAFLTTSITGTAGQVIGSIRVAVEDAGGNVVTSDARTITVSITPATGTANAVLGGTLAVAAVGGVATFSTLSINLAGAAYTLAATTTLGLTSATSTAFDILSVGPPAKLAFSVQPANTVAGASIAPTIQVVVQDVGGATATSSTAAITLGIETNPGSGVLAGTVTVNAIAGVASFSGISINKIGTGYKLNATSGTLTKAVSATFNITAGAATKVGFLVAPSNAVASTVMAPAVQVAIQDVNGNTVTSSTANVTLTIGAGPGGSILGGTATAAAVAGVATFSTLTLSPASTAYQLTASSPSITSATSPTFTITATVASPIKLGFLTQPTNVASNTAIVPSIQVAVQDANGSTVTAPSASITLALTTNSGGAVATGSLTLTTTSGVATFTNVQVGLAGTGYTLVASAAAAGLTSATSAAFNVTAGAPAKLAFVVQPTSSVAGTPFAPDAQVAVQDAAGNLVANATNVVTLNIGNNPGNSAIRGTTSIAAVNGIATFAGARLTKTGAGYTLQAAGTNLQFATSTSFDITPAPASALSFKTQPVNGTAGVVQTSPIQVAVVDSLGNTITTATDQISLLINSSTTAGAVLTGTTPVAASSGVATFSDARLRTASFYSLAATAPNLATATSQQFLISAAPAIGLAWGVQPASPQIQNASILGNGSSSLRVDVVDSIGNIVTSNSTATVTIAIATGAGTLSGKSAVGVSNGSAFFGDLKINNFGTGYTLSAASTGLNSATSSSFTISQFGTAAKWAFIQQPNDVLPSVTFSPAVTVALEDQFGNIIANNSSATVSIGTQSNAAGATTNNANNIVVVNGVATFTSMTMSGSLDGLVLSAFGGTFNSAISSAFNVAPTSTLAGVYDVAVTGNSAFYIERSGTGSVKKIDLTTGGVTTIAGSLNNPGGITTDGINVYWIEDGAGAASGTIVRRTPVGSVSVTSSGTMTGGAGIIQTDNAGNLFFIANGSTNREIKKLSTSFASGAAATTFAQATCGIVSTCVPAFTISAGTMYFSNGSNTISSTSTGTFSATSLVTSIASAPLSLAVSSSTIYWNTGTSIFSASATTPSTVGTTSATGATSITRLAFDGTSLFALDAGAKTILKFNVSTFTSTVAASVLAASTQAMAMDSFSLFWADNLSPTRLRRTVK